MVIDFDERDSGWSVGNSVHIPESEEQTNDKREHHDGVTDGGDGDAPWSPGPHFLYLVT